MNIITQEAKKKQAIVRRNTKQCGLISSSLQPCVSMQQRFTRRALVRKVLATEILRLLSKMILIQSQTTTCSSVALTRPSEIIQRIVEPTLTNP